MIATVRRQEGFTLVEVLIVVMIIGVLAAIAVPGLLHARIAGNEASAIGSLRAIGSAQSTYAASCGNGLYAQTLDGLGTGPSGASPFISPDLGAAPTTTKSGYVLSMDGTPHAGTACNGSSTLASGYHAWADPVSNTTGRRFFGLNTTHTLWEASSTLSSMGDTAAPSIGTPIQ